MPGSPSRNPVTQTHSHQSVPASSSRLAKRQQDEEGDRPEPGPDRDRQDAVPAVSLVVVGRLVGHVRHGRRMRLFSALVPPPAVLDAVARAVELTRSTGADLRWARPDQWHLTLGFYAKVEPEQLAGLSERLGRVARRHEPLDLRMVGGGRFDGRVLWLGVRGDREPLGRLATATVAAASRVRDRGRGPRLPTAPDHRAQSPADRSAARCRRVGRVGVAALAGGGAHAVPLPPRGQAKRMRCCAHGRSGTRSRARLP